MNVPVSLFFRPPSSQFHNRNMDNPRFWASSHSSSFSGRAFTPVLTNQPSFPPLEFQRDMAPLEHHSLEIIRGASHHMLLASGNQTYSELHTRWIKAMSELDAEKYVSSHFLHILMAICTILDASTVYYRRHQQHIKQLCQTGCSTLLGR